MGFEVQCQQIDGSRFCWHSVDMVRTQIQLPDALFSEAKRVCEAKEISFAEFARRGIEYLLSVYPPPTAIVEDWEPPKPRALGWKGLSDEEIKAEAQLTTNELSFYQREALRG